MSDCLSVRPAPKSRQRGGLRRCSGVSYWSAARDLRPFSSWRTEDQYDWLAVRKAGYERGQFYDEEAYFIDESGGCLFHWDGHLGLVTGEEIRRARNVEAQERRVSSPPWDVCQECGGSGRG